MFLRCSPFPVTVANEGSGWDPQKVNQVSWLMVTWVVGAPQGMFGIMTQLCHRGTWILVKGQNWFPKYACDMCLFFLSFLRQELIRELVFTGRLSKINDMVG